MLKIFEKRGIVPKFPGLKLDKPDPRDYTEIEVGAPPRLSIIDLIKKYGTKFNVSNLNPDYQDGQGECVLQSWTYLYRLHYFKKYGKDVDLSEAMAYAMAEELEPGPPDPGTYSRLGGEVFRKFGVCEAKFYQPDRRKTSFKNYVDPYKIPQKAIENARLHKIESYVRVDGLGWGALTLEGLMNGIINFLGVEIAMRGDRKNWLLAHGVIEPPTTSNLFYHATVLDGWNASGNWRADPEKNILLRGANWWDPKESGTFSYGKGRYWLSPSKWLKHLNGAFGITGLLTPGPLSGWVAGKFLESIQRFRKGDVVKNFENLNLRKNPSASGLPISTLTKNTKLEILSEKPVKAGGFDWYLVKRVV